MDRMRLAEAFLAETRRRNALGEEPTSAEVGQALQLPPAAAEQVARDLVQMKLLSGYIQGDDDEWRLLRAL